MKTKALSSSFVESVTEYDPAQITPDLLEVALDNIFDDGLIKDIPIVRSIAGLYKASVSLRDRALVKKLVRFLFSLGSVSSQTRNAFKARMNIDEDFRCKVGEKLLLVLERIDDMGKPSLIAHAFKAYMEEQIDFDMFQRLASATDKCFYSDLMSFKAGNPNGLSPQAKLELCNAGITELESTPSINLSSRNNRYQITELGRNMLKFVLKK